MILQDGDKVLVVYRRLFEADESKFFVGEVDAYEAGIVRVTGYSWVHDFFSGQYIEKKDQRTKIFSISSGTLIVYQLPITLDINSLRFERSSEGRFLLTNGTDYRMDLSEKIQGLPRGLETRGGEPRGNK